jgi:hypothetical protein
MQLYQTSSSKTQCIYLYKKQYTNMPQLGKTKTKLPLYIKKHFTQDKELVGAMHRGGKGL